MTIVKKKNISKFVEIARDVLIKVSTTGDVIFVFFLFFEHLKRFCVVHRNTNVTQIKKHVDVLRRENFIKC